MAIVLDQCTILKGLLLRFKIESEEQALLLSMPEAWYNKNIASLLLNFSVFVIVVERINKKGRHPWNV